MSYTVVSAPAYALLLGQSTGISSLRAIMTKQCLQQDCRIIAAGVLMGHLAPGAAYWQKRIAGSLITVTVAAMSYHIGLWLHSGCDVPNADWPARAVYPEQRQLREGTAAHLVSGTGIQCVHSACACPCQAKP